MLKAVDREEKQQDGPGHESEHSWQDHTEDGHMYMSCCSFAGLILAASILAEAGRVVLRFTRIARFELLRCHKAALKAPQCSDSEFALEVGCPLLVTMCGVWM